MRLMTKKLLLACLSLSIFSLSATAADPLLSLKNLERERAAYLDKVLSQTQDSEQQHASAVNKLRQLSDMERMVIRDDRLVEQNSTLVSNAFSNFELTFLVHASAEKEATVLSHWLEQIGYSSEAVLSSKPGFRK